MENKGTVYIDIPQLCDSFSYFEEKALELKKEDKNKWLETLLSQGLFLGTMTQKIDFYDCVNRGLWEFADKGLLSSKDVEYIAKNWEKLGQIHKHEAMHVMVLEGNRKAIESKELAESSLQKNYKLGWVMGALFSPHFPIEIEKKVLEKSITVPQNALSPATIKSSSKI